MRVYLFLAAYFTSLGLTLKRPVYGIYVYVLLFYIPPVYSWWGRIIHHNMGIRTSFVAAIVLLISYLIHRESYVDHNRNVDKVPEATLYLLLFLMVVSTILATVSVEVSIQHNIEFAKRILLFVLMTRIMGSNREMKIFIWLNLIGCFYFGWEATFNDYMVGGRLEGIGGPGTREAEGLATHLAIFIPYLGLYLLSGRKWEKLAVCIISPFILNAIILTRTRAAFLSLVVMAIYFIFFCGRKYRKKAVALSIVAGILFAFLADPAFWTRINTISEYRTERSANMRIELWKGATEMMGEFPFGIGGDNFEILAPQYVEDLDRPRAVHNTFLLVGVENGWLALMAFVFLIFRMQRIFRHNRLGKSLSEEDERRKIDMFALEVGFVGFLVGAFFVNRLMADGLFWIMAVAVVGDKLRRNIENQPVESAQLTVSPSSAVHGFPRPTMNIGPSRFDIS